MGKGAEFVRGEVNDKFKRSHRIWVVRDIPSGGGGIYVLWARCTHLGCTPNWMPVENKFKCPCHGSGFRGFSRESGRGALAQNFEGPAPRSLARLKVWIDRMGEINVDKSVSYLFERGDWQRPGSRARV